jgi:hypothetical protein
VGHPVDDAGESGSVEDGARSGKVPRHRTI